MTQGRHLCRCALLALLALALLSGGSLAAGDLFDDDYSDCPAKTRLRDGQIADLTVARDAEEADEVNVAWAATDPVTWGLGANAYRASLVVLLDDGGDLQAKTVSLGTRKQTFSGVATGKEVTVQMAIVVDTAAGDYLISDILEASVNQSLTAPSFSTEWLMSRARPSWLEDRPTEPVNYPLPGFGRMYYLGYNENFANYRAGTAVYNHRPETPRLRIGLAHGGEDDDARDDVKFNAYLLRLVDEDGDVVPEGDDVATMVTDYGKATSGSDAGYDRALVVAMNASSLHGGSSQLFVPAGISPEQAAQNRAALAAAGPFVNVRINDGGAITPPLYRSELMQAVYANRPSYVGDSPHDRITGIQVIPPGGNVVYAFPPDAHRDFPIDVLASDRTYTIEAWAVNEDHAVISPKTTLKVRAQAQTPLTLVRSNVRGNPGRFFDYLNGNDSNGNGLVDSGTLLVTEFTVLK